MVRPATYDLMYRFWAPWDGVGVRQDLLKLLAREGVDPLTYPTAVDLGCGTGANVVHLAQNGYQAVGVDFSRVALRKAEQRADQAGVAGRCRFVLGDLTAVSIPGAEGPFDLLIDLGTLDDLKGRARRAMADHIKRLARPGALFLFWCFYASPNDLPRFTLNGPSRVSPVIKPGEERDLFEDAFVIEPFSRAETTACFLMIRR